MRYIKPFILNETYSNDNDILNNIAEFIDAGYTTYIESLSDNTFYIIDLYVKDINSAKEELTSEILDNIKSRINSDGYEVKILSQENGKDIFNDINSLGNSIKILLTNINKFNELKSKFEADGSKLLYATEENFKKRKLGIAHKQVYYRGNDKHRYFSFIELNSISPDLQYDLKYEFFSDEMKSQDMDPERTNNLEYANIKLIDYQFRDKKII